MDKSNPNCGCGEEAVCNEAELRCDPCCRCIPQRLCAKLEAYGCDCDGLAELLQGNGNGEFRGEIVCGSEVAEIVVLLHFENQVCYWRVIIESFYIDELFEIGPEKQSCEYPELVLTVPFAACDVTLEITRHEYRDLKPITDESNDCSTEPFCGECRCTCDCLCVTIIRPNGSYWQGEICDVSYSDDDPPLWSGDVPCGYSTPCSLTLTLSRDEYSGACLFGGSAGDDELELVEVGDCKFLAASWVLSDYTKISVRCKECSCDEGSGQPCCPDRCMPTVRPPIQGNCTGAPGENPMPLTLSIEISGNSEDGCLDLSGTLELTETYYRYAGVLTGSCEWCCETDAYKTCTRHFCLSVFLNCHASGGWFIEFKQCGPADPPWVAGVPPDTFLTQGSCNPVLVVGDIECFRMAGMWCFVPGPAVPPIPPVIHPDFCLSVVISETL
jgi:hypothetical protein